MAAPSPTATQSLVDVLVDRKYPDLPTPVTHEATRLVLDFLGVALSGSDSESGRIAAGFAARLGGPREATLLADGSRVAAVHAAFANAIASHSIELDDVDDLALFHHGPPIVAAALAVAQATGAGGTEFLTSVVAGCETMTRLSKATNPALRDRGFHTTPTCGVFGAAMSAGLLLHLGPAQLVDALGLAGAQAGGLMEMYGTSMQKRFNPGPAARDGVTAAELAKAGFTGADSVIDGERGFARAFAGAFDRDAFADGLGEHIPVVVEYKPYSCARPIHNAIDATLEIVRDHGVTAEDVTGIQVYRHPSWAAYHVIAEPRTFHEAQVSLPYSVAVALLYGSALPEQYQRAGVAGDPAVPLARMVVVRPLASLRRGVSCRVVISTRDGAEYTAEVDHPLGSVQRPLSDSRLEAKFVALAAPKLGEPAARSLAAAVWDIGAVEDMNTLVAATAAAR
jgi:2-methylcitrate dehydratase PrpD